MLDAATSAYHNPNSPGRNDREGMSYIQFFDAFPTEESARVWFEAVVWPRGRFCPHCYSLDTHEAKHAKSPYRCRNCKKYFSVKSATVMADSRVPLRK